MACESRFYICEKCGNLVGMINCSGAPLVCCGQPMKALIANTTDAAQEKHVPVITEKAGCVTVGVGSVPHPMEEKHYIQWIYLQTEQGGQRKNLNPGDEPKAVFCLADGDKAVAAYAYCNLHSLWVANL